MEMEEVRKRWIELQTALGWERPCFDGERFSRFSEAVGTQVFSWDQATGRVISHIDGVVTGCVTVADGSEVALKSHEDFINFMIQNKEDGR